MGKRYAQEKSKNFSLLRSQTISKWRMMKVLEKALKISKEVNQNINQEDGSQMEKFYKECRELMEKIIKNALKEW
jgi:CRISPR/Cas system CSM-associated protein Csm2 small subunit